MSSLEKSQADVFTGLAVTAALIMTPTYRAKVVMVVQDKNASGMSVGGNLAALASLAASWANAYVDFINQAARKRASTDADQRLVYLRRELESTNIISMQLSLHRLIEQELQRKMLAATDDEYMFRIVDRAETPDRKNFIKPDRLLLTAVGFMFGIAFGFVVALLRGALRTDGKPAAG